MIGRPSKAIRPARNESGIEIKPVYTEDDVKRSGGFGFVGEPEDVAGVVVFLASTHARYISGATINVSGGFLMY